VHDSPVFLVRFRVSRCACVAGLCASEYDEARKLFKQIRDREPYRMEDLDLYSNMLFVKDDKVRIAAIPI
jgi:hypothetical protein